MKYAEIEWVDNQPYSPEYDDLYYSVSGGLSETDYVFLKQNDLIHRFAQAEKFTIAEAGFGTGLNFIATCEIWLKHAPRDSVLSYVGIEKSPLSPENIIRVAKQWPSLGSLYEELIDDYPPAISGSHILSLFNGRVELTLDFLDIDDALLGNRFKADVWFLDGFSPKQNENMWSGLFFEAVARHSKIGTTLSTYTAAGHVRRGLEKAGFKVTKVKGHANKREMITAKLIRTYHGQSKLPWYEYPQRSNNKKFNNKQSVVIIGAGIVGLTTALTMIKNGIIVTLIDKHETIAQEASGNPAAVIAPRLSLGNVTEQRYYVNAFLYAIKQLDKLQSNSKIVFWHKTGVIEKVKREKAESILALYQSNHSFVRGNNENCDEQDVMLGYPAAGWAAIDLLCREIFSQIEAKLKFISASVTSIAKTDGRWQVKGNNTTLAEADNIVLATGQSITQMNETAWIPIDVVRGQMTLLDATDNSKSITKTVNFGKFLTPIYNAKHYVGATYDRNNINTELTQKSQDENYKSLNENFPNLFEKNAQLAGRVGFRAISDDRMPVVGMVCNRPWFEQHYADLCHGRSVEKYSVGKYHEGLFVNGAHGSRGLTTSFLSAEIIVALLLGKPVPVASSTLNALNPARFIVRALKRDQKMPG